jgi:LysM repeat protein
MKKSYILAAATSFLLAAFLCQPVWAKEDTAQIALKKTAVSKQYLHKYTVKKGDVISAIIRRIPGITEEDIPDNYRIVKKLNPSVPDLNKLYAGQILVLPGKDAGPAEDRKDQTADAVPAVSAGAANARVYTIRRGDSLIRIIHQELKTKTNADTIKILQLVKSLNPHIANLNKIYIGKTIKLPGKTVVVQAPEEPGRETVETAVMPPAEEKMITVAEKKIMAPEARLAVLKHIIGQMNGSVLSSGNYYLPIPKTGQVAIDCSKIPVLEFDDQTTVFLDIENRLHDSLKKIIRENWKNFHTVDVDRKDDVIAILRKVIAVTKTYGMTKKDKPVSSGSQPAVEIMVDWMIVKADFRHTAPLLQGLRLVSSGNPLLPKAIKNYARKNGLIITEIDVETGVTGKPEEIYALPPLPVFPRTTAKEFSYGLVTYLGLTAVKDADIKVFDLVKDGFNLSIKADVLINYADRPCIIYSRSLPQQFVNMLKQMGYGLTFVADSDSPKVTLGKILHTLAIPYADGYFTFSGMEMNQAPYTFGFTGTKIKTEKDRYIIDFAIDDGLRGLIGELWSADIARF